MKFNATVAVVGKIMAYETWKLVVYLKYWSGFATGVFIKSIPEFQNEIVSTSIKLRACVLNILTDPEWTSVAFNITISSR